MTVSFKDYLTGTVYRRQDIQQIVDPKPDQKPWIRFDKYQAYLSNDIDLQDGLDNSFTTYSYEPTGERTKINFAADPCRINTYGDSYTLCQQSSNNETWQEYLAAHLQEPVRNFGIGGQGVLHAFLRMKKAEVNPETSAKFVILNVFCDNHLRNLEPARWIRTLGGKPLPADMPTKHVMGFPWSHLSYDMEKHAFVFNENPLNAPEDLYRYCEEGSFWELAKDNLFAKAQAMYSGAVPEDVNDLEALAEEFGLKIDLRDPAIRSDSAWTLALEYGMRSTQHIVREANAFCESHGKQLLVVTSYSADQIISATEKGTHMAEAFSEFLKGSGLFYCETMDAYVADFSVSKQDLMKYMHRYFVNPAGAAVWGHLNPIGNQNYAFHIKDAVVEMLSPKPKPYRHLEEEA